MSLPLCHSLLRFSPSILFSFSFLFFFLFSLSLSLSLSLSSNIFSLYLTVLLGSWPIKAHYFSRSRLYKHMYPSSMIKDSRVSCQHDIRAINCQLALAAAISIRLPSSSFCLPLYLLLLHYATLPSVCSKSNTIVTNIHPTMYTTAIIYSQVLSKESLFIISPKNLLFVMKKTKTRRR